MQAKCSKACLFVCALRFVLCNIRLCACGTAVIRWRIVSNTVRSRNFFQGWGTIGHDVTVEACVRSLSYPQPTRASGGTSKAPPAGPAWVEPRRKQFLDVFTQLCAILRTYANTIPDRTSLEGCKSSYRDSEWPRNNQYLLSAGVETWNNGNRTETGFPYVLQMLQTSLLHFRAL